MSSKSRFTAAERFWPKVDVRGPDECWPWKAGRNNRGYGLFRIGMSRMGAHRAAWLISVGPTGGLLVLHKCDNPCCVNTQHLFLGTHAENMADKASKGRCATEQPTKRGELHHTSKLSEVDVIDIRTVYSLGGTQADLGRAYGVGPSTIHKIVHRENWRHLP